VPLLSLDHIDTKAQLLDLDRADCEETLYVFYKNAWKFIDPAPWKDAWAIDAICEHLQAIVDGQIRRLIINCPPRIGKSSLTSVAFPAWTWAQAHKSHTSGAGVPFLYGSYNDKLSLRDSVKCRRLIESKWYSERWANRFKLTSDQNTKGRFTNDQGGERLITSISAGVTGEGGNIICIDDPNAANDLSEVAIENVIDWWKGTMPTRPNDQNLSAFVIIQQRLAENDLTGHILETETEGWAHLCLPARYESERSFFTPIGWKDPRTVENELLWPERLSEAALVRLENIMGPYVFAGQMQQRPEPAGGGIIKREWWRLWLPKKFPAMDFTLGCLDSAYTEDQMNDPSGFCVWGVYSAVDDKLREEATRIISIDRHPSDRLRLTDGSIPVSAQHTRSLPRVMLMTAWEDRLELNALVKRVIKSCIDWRVDLLLIENKASGISVAQEMRRMFTLNSFGAAFGVQLFDPKSQDKFARLHSVAPLFAEGLIFAPSEEYAWVEKVIKQNAQFPKGAHDEFVDLTSMGLRYLRDNGLISRSVEFAAENEALKDYGRLRELAPLYPV
jgi:predicted phage terminase large subunit-like protein